MVSEARDAGTLLPSTDINEALELYNKVTCNL